MRRVNIRTNTRTPSWRTLRKRVWKRDKGKCGICLRIIDPGEYNLGHIVDRCRGGRDTMRNLMVMCETCNDGKPPHATRKEFFGWVMNLWKQSGLLSPLRVQQ